MSKVNNTLRRALTVEWIGQMGASVFWMASVFVYGIQAIGDVLQLCAALAWMLANIATLVNTPSKDERYPVASVKSQSGSLT